MGTEYTRDIPFAKVNRYVLDAMNQPTVLYYFVMATLAMFIGAGVVAWIYQVKTGMGVSGLNHPVGWGTYITNFVFWVGIAHSGTLISAILYLVRSKWRDAISRSTEAMTVIAVMTAGIFPLVHLGRLWVFYFILPYPNQRLLYPNFMSPIVWDVIAVLTYFTVSIIFFYFGLIPDAAAVRDEYTKTRGPKYWKTKLFKVLSLGWSGTLSQWRHYNRSYLYFAALATPLVVSVHSIVSWDFAMSLLPGWHSTLFAPYFVAGAIHSGLSMALTLMIPMRKLLNLQYMITEKHLEMIAKLIIFTTSILAYAYIIEPLIETYSGNTFNTQFSHWRMTGPTSWIYYMILVLNILVPLTFLAKKIRLNLKWLFIASILINIGMWFERYFIVVSSTSHDFMPHNWGSFAPSLVELTIFAGLTAFFFFMFMLFAKMLPTVSITDFKDYLLKDTLPVPTACEGERLEIKENVPELKRKLFVFSSANQLIRAVKSFCSKNFYELETFTPSKIPEVEKLLHVEKSPVKYWTFIGGLCGLTAGYLLQVKSVQIYHLVVGGKPPVSLIPFVLIMFELTILFATIANFAGAIYYTKLYKRKINPFYNSQFSVDKFGLMVVYRKGEDDLVSRIGKTINAEEEHDY
ncbi:MAG TPA: quinol:electron acceptor oxidoreductase subunit ActD [Bacteroidales bacterium]|nr:quinol:electron acceptor oxidoreductase subunit ActD [Bacteroidales bacterium]